MKKIIELPHAVYDFNCMISGLEDMLDARTGLRWPPYLMFFGSYIGFSYEERPGAAAPYRVWPGWGIGKGQYQFLAEVFGYRWSATEGKPFAESWTLMRESIDRGAPLILGELDMFHLPYYRKFYRRIHVPIHYITLVGYDEADGTACVLDNGHAGVQQVPVVDLRRALDLPPGGDSRPNTFYAFDLAGMAERLDRRAVMRKILCKRGRLFLDPPNETQGVRAMRKLAAEFADWERALWPKAWRASLRELVTFTCSTVPMPPQKLVPYPLQPHMIPHQGARDRFAGLLEELARDENLPECRDAAAGFRESGLLFQEMTDRITDFLAAFLYKARAKRNLEAVPSLLGRIADIETRTFGILARLEGAPAGERGTA